MRTTAIGLDLGGTDLKAGLIDASGTVLHFIKRPSRVREGPEAPLEVMAECVRELLRRAREEAQDGSTFGSLRIGLGTPGTLDADTGTLVGATPHLPHWSDYPLRSKVEERLSAPVHVDNDANLAALGEHRFGAARGARVALVVTIGTGVGCGIVVDGQILHGAHGGAGELGHLPIGDGVFACRCGVENCIEPEVSGSGLVRAARTRGMRVTGADEVVALARAGEEPALELMDRFGESLGRTLAVAINLLNPQVVVVGGGVSLAGELLLGRVRSSIERHALASHRRGLGVVPAALGERSGVAGAAALCWS